MAKLDKQHRLLVPKDLAVYCQIQFSQRVGIFLSETEQSVIIKNPSNFEEFPMIAIVSCDRGRLYLSKEMLNILNASFESDFLFYVIKGDLYLRKK